MEALGDGISINQASFSWSEDIEATPALKNLTLNIPKRSLVGVIGRIQYKCCRLTLMSQGDIAYASQDALIQNVAVKQNILFLNNYDFKLYRRVLENCSLELDLIILPGGDMTEIGEKGVNLSGGKKQRVNLARAVYQNRYIYLLDDSLSAVEAHVGRHIFQHIVGYPQAQSDISPVYPYMCHNGSVGCQTRVLVTHALSVLPETDLVVVMEGGQVREMGTYQDLLARPDGALALLMEEHAQQLIQDQKNAPSKTEEIQRQVNIQSSPLLHQLKLLFDKFERLLKAHLFHR
ncbi:ABCC1 [Cordylochernes scorpioides]|uniref:ABCC1 n=1 Tax=Cordylochernes scorpioides TaxID=51811 RepID=A0ABY6LEZ6_9ARAC|nr:ABCC1 [Cordylochernes scorpioides]